MPESTQSHPTLPTRRRRSAGFLLPQPRLLSVTAPTARRLLVTYGHVRGSDSANSVAEALGGHRTALRQVCDSLQLEHRSESPEEGAAREALDGYGHIRGGMDPVRTTEALGVLRTSLEQLLERVEDRELAVARAAAGSPA